MKDMKTGCSKWQKVIGIAAMTLILIHGSVQQVWATEPAVLEDEYSNEELEEIIDAYLESMEHEEKEEMDEIPDVDTIINPKLQMEYAGQGKLRYTLPNQVSFTSTVPNGMITEQTVRVELPDGAIGTVEKDNEEVSLMADGIFLEPGSYRLKLVFYQSQSAETEEYHIYEVIHEFTIIEEKNGSLACVDAPDQFEISEVIKDGIKQNNPDPQSYVFDGDGVYEVRYQDIKTGTIQLKTSFNRDTTPPSLIFSKDITQKSVTAPLEFTTTEPDCTVMAFYNGNRSQVFTNTLTAPGVYELDVYDTAGNRNSYHVTIRKTYKLIDTPLIILALIFLIGLGGNLLFLRRNMRVK